MRTRFLLCTALLSILPLSICIADDNGDLPVLKTKVKTLAAFKNGLGFVFRSGETKMKDGWAVMDQIPPAALGTLWIGTTSKSGPVTDVISYKSKLVREYEPLNFAELLEANVGRTVTITHASGGMSPITGKILSVPTQRQPDALGPITDISYPIGYANQPQIVLIKPVSSDRVLAINKNSVMSMEFHDETLPGMKITREVPSAKVRVSGDPRSAEITIAYLEKGINWSPSYLINIQNEKEADITLEAVLANDVEDLEDVDVSFVVGYPNFTFADSITPLALQQTVAAFIQGLSARPNQPYDYGAITRQSIMYNTPVFSDGYFSAPERRVDAGYSSTKPMPGETNEDLYFYRQQHVTLKKGDRARYTVFSGRVPYEHIYEWTIPDSMLIDDRGYRTNRPTGPQDESSMVWHALRMENKTVHPWTTAPAFVVNKSMPVAQDVLKYTPPGGKSTLRLTVATDVRAEQMQTETARDQVNIAGYSFDRVDVAGKLTVKNWKQKKITMNVRKSLIGEVKEAGQNGKVTKMAKNLAAYNPTSEIEWEFALNPGEQKELTYNYTILIRR